MNWNIPSMDKVKALLIVAHPDDETIFCGGTMLYYPNWEWTVVCATYPEGSERYSEFQKAIKSYENLGVNIKSHMTLGLIDFIGRDFYKWEIQLWSDTIKSKGFSPEIVFTHNNKSEGDYVHRHHQILNKILHKQFSNVWEFTCPISGILEPPKSKIDKVPLSTDILKRKTFIFNNCHRSQRYDTWKAIPKIMSYEFKKGPEIFTSN